MAMEGADPLAIMKAMDHADIKTTMIYGSLGKSHIRDQVEKLNAIQVPLPPTSMPSFLPAPRSLPTRIPELAILRTGRAKRVLGHGIPGTVIRARLLARSETTPPRRRRPR